MSGVTMAGEMAGTLAYMPPEQLRNFRDVKPQSDIYAVGMTAYSLLTGSLALDLSKIRASTTRFAPFSSNRRAAAAAAPHIPERRATSSTARLQRILHSAGKARRHAHCPAPFNIIAEIPCNPWHNPR
jgi:serine/threonine protein kinase